MAPPNGLNNKSKGCFNSMLNAVLQCYFSTLHQHECLCRGKKNVHTYLNEIYREVYDERRDTGNNSISTVGLCSVLAEIAGIDTSISGDCNHFFQKLIDADLNSRGSCRSSNGMFHLELVTSVTCTQCDTTITKEHVTSSLSLSLHGNDGVQSALKNHLNKTEDGYCSRCNSVTKCLHEVNIKNNLRTICLHLLRSHQDDLPQLLHSDKNIEIAINGTMVPFELRAILVHDDASLPERGHAAFIEATGKWWITEDSSVEEIPVDGLMDTSPYMLYFVKKPEERTQISAPISTRETLCRDKTCCKRAHRHCENCGMHYEKLDRYKKHVSECQYRQKLSINVSSKPRKKCPECGLDMLENNLRRHIEKFHPSSKIHTGPYITCVDPDAGVYAVQTNVTGIFTVHHAVKKTIGTMYSYCEGKMCKYEKNVSGNVSHECKHLKDISSSSVFNPPPTELDVKKLIDMRDKSLLKKERIEEVSKLNDYASSNGKRLIVKIAVPDGCDKIMFSVLVSHGPHHWCSLGRTVTYFEKSTNKYHCKCRQNSAMNCVHKSIVRWFLYEHIPELIVPDKHEDPEYPTDDDNSSDEDSMSTVDEPKPATVKSSRQQAVEKRIAYLLANKKIPTSVMCNPEEVLNPPERIIPTENVCECGVQLSSALKIHSHGKIVTSKRIYTGINVYTKVCPQCHMEYHYQEFRDGLHNFDNNLFLSIRFASELIIGMKNHAAIGRTLATKKDLNDWSSIDTTGVQAAALHFAAMIDFNYSFTCVLCGNHPAKLILDVRRKSCFPVNEEAYITEDENPKETVDVEKFWSEVQYQILAEGYRLPNENIYDVKPHIGYWAPWIGKDTRRSNEVYNTEFSKASKINDEEDTVVAYSEERLLELLEKEKRHVVEKICKAAGIKVSGASKFDMVQALRSKSVSNEQYNKVFAKFWKASGGQLIAVCEHGVTYAIKSILRAEGPSDYTDILRSLEHVPTFTITDIAHMLAKYANKRFDNFFRPNDGRLCEDSQENIDLAESDNLIISLTELYACDDTSSDEKHPITGTSNKYSIFDWFHQGNTNQKSEILRRISFIQQLPGSVNTESCEQRHRAANRDNYFLNKMRPHINMFVSRLLTHLRNEDINKVALKHFEKVFNSSVEVGGDGQACLRDRNHLSVVGVQPSESRPLLQPQCSHQNDEPGGLMSAAASIAIQSVLLRSKPSINETHKPEAEIPTTRPPKRHKKMTDTSKSASSMTHPIIPTVGLSETNYQRARRLFPTCPIGPMLSVLGAVESNFDELSCDLLLGTLQMYETYESMKRVVECLAPFLPPCPQRCMGKNIKMKQLGKFGDGYITFIPEDLRLTYKMYATTSEDNACLYASASIFLYSDQYHIGFLRLATFVTGIHHFNELISQIQRKFESHEDQMLWMAEFNQQSTSELDLVTLVEEELMKITKFSDSGHVQFEALSLYMERPIELHAGVKMNYGSATYRYANESMKVAMVPVSLPTDHLRLNHIVPLIHTVPDNLCLAEDLSLCTGNHNDSMIQCIMCRRQIHLSCINFEGKPVSTKFKCGCDKVFHFQNMSWYSDENNVMAKFTSLHTEINTVINQVSMGNSWRFKSFRRNAGERAALMYSATPVGLLIAAQDEDCDGSLVTAFTARVKKMTPFGTSEDENLKVYAAEVLIRIVMEVEAVPRFFADYLMMHTGKFFDFKPSQSTEGLMPQ